MTSPSSQKSFVYSSVDMDWKSRNRHLRNAFWPRSNAWPTVWLQQWIFHGTPGRRKIHFKTTVFDKAVAGLRLKRWVKKDGGTELSFTPLLTLQKWLTSYSIIYFVDKRENLATEMKQEILIKTFFWSQTKGCSKQRLRIADMKMANYAQFYDMSYLNFLIPW